MNDIKNRYCFGISTKAKSTILHSALKQNKTKPKKIKNQCTHKIKILHSKQDC